MKHPALRSLPLAVLLCGCGYHLVHAGPDPLGPFSVAAAPIHVPDAALAAAAEEGARAELSREGALASSRGGAEIEIEILRVDESAEGIRLAGADRPGARGLRLTATGRARVRRAGSREVVRDTGEVRASEVGASPERAGAAVVASDEVGRAAARRLGELLVRRLMGFPEPGEP